MIPFSESDGGAVSLQRIECRWCGKYLGVQICVAEMADTVSHGMCPACKDRQLASLEKTLVPGGRLEGAINCVTCGLINRADAGSPAPISGRMINGKSFAERRDSGLATFDGARPAGLNEAASGAKQDSPRVTRISAHGVKALSALEHLSRGPAASFTFNGPELLRPFRARVIDWMPPQGELPKQPEGRK